MGNSLAFRRPVSDVLGDALVNSLKLAILAFIIVVPLAILGGVFAALQRGPKRDRLISLGGLSATAMPDFVWAVVLILVFGLMLGIFPATATAPPGSGFFDQIYYLILPAFCLVFVLFGYIARMARAGTIEALDADYTRTAILKGLPRRTRRARPRAAQLAAADDRRRRHPGRLPARRPARDRDDLQLPGHRPGALPRRDRRRTSRCSRRAC